MDDMFDDIFGNMFHGGSASGRSRRTSGFTGGFGGESFRSKGSDIKAGITVGFDEAAFGGDKVITLSNPENPGQPGQSLKVHIPAGIDNGQSVRIREKGEPGINGGPRGDLLVEVVVSRHPSLQRQDMNIYSTAQISFAQAALGGEIRIHTVDGDVLYEVKPGTQTNTRIRLKGKGVPSLRNKSVRGDHYVDLVVQTPTGLSADAKEALRQFDALTGDSLNRTGAQDGAGSSDKQEKPKKKKGFMDKIKESLDDI